MRAWLGRALLSLTVAVSCAKATDEKLLGGDDDDDSGGTSSGGFSGTGFGGTASGFGGTSGKGGTGASGGTGTTGGTSGKGGAGGTTPTGGTSGDGGASDGGEGGTDPCSPTSTPTGLRLDYQASTRSVTEDPEGEFRIVNASTQPIALADLTVRYWFHSEFSCADTIAQTMVNVVVFQLGNPFSEMGPANVAKTVADTGTGAPGCDAYFELGFPNVTADLQPDQVANVKYFMQVPIYTRPHDQSNDYSYGACTVTHVYFDRVTLYRNGRLVSGTPPGGGGGEGGAGGEGGGGMGGI
jgi:hypothetical protein